MPERSSDRSYALRRDRPLGDEARRAARGRAERALDQLRTKAGADAATAVHEARKDLKKLRSLLRLVRDELGRERYSAENARYRDAGRLLSASRDAEVKLETVRGLRDRYVGEAPAVEGLTAALEAERDRVASSGGTELAASIEEATKAIEEAAAAIGDWPLDADGWELVGPGVKRSYRRGRKRFRSVLEDPDAAAVHEWRKSVKDLWYQLRLLRGAWPAVLGATSEEAHDLSDLLGEHHDLTVLEEEVRDGAPHDGAGKLLELAERRQAELLDLALPLGRRLYAEKPGRFSARLSAYWEASRVTEPAAG